MADGAALQPSQALAERHHLSFPNESDDYRRARNALLAEEIELRRHIERVAAQRRALPPGGEVTADYRFMGENGPASLADMFGEKDTLVLYSFMYGAQRALPCPMCTNAMNAWAKVAADIRQRVALATVARSPIERLIALKADRGWPDIPFYSDLDDAFSRDFHAIAPDGGDDAGLHVFTREGDKVRHFWSGEMTGESADPGQDPRGAPDISSLWTVLDLTPEGRGADWYPKLSY